MLSCTPVRDSELRWARSELPRALNEHTHGCPGDGTHLLQCLERPVAAVAVVQDVQQLVQQPDLRLKDLTADQLQHIFALRQQRFNVCSYTNTNTIIIVTSQPRGAESWLSHVGRMRRVISHTARQ